MNKIFKKIKKQIKNNNIILYMKGTPEFPSCGFSSKVSEILNLYNIKYAYVNVLSNPDIRLELPKFANWPTFPQLWINGELIGGYDIITEMHKNNNLKKIINNYKIIKNNKQV